MALQEIRRPMGVMDFDTTATLVNKVDYRYALNFENGFAQIDQEGAGRNVKGMIQVPFTMPNPSATYKTLGALEDIEGATIIYFVWASDGNHLILRYYPLMTSTANPNGVIQTVIQYQFGWQQTEFITSIDLVNGKLLYWTDSVEPRKININKANNTAKFKSWNVFTYQSYTFSGGSITFDVTITNLSGGVIATAPITIIGGGNAIQAYTEIATQLNAQVGAFVTATALQWGVQIQENQVNAYNITFAPAGFVVVPNNFYGYNLIDRFFQLAKWPTNQQPNPTYQQDPSSNINKVQQIPFQFRVQLFYDDYEPSVLSQWSQIAITNIDGGLYNKDNYNYIQLLFNNEYLSDPNTWVLVKRIKVTVREHNSGVESEVANNWLTTFYDIPVNAATPQLFYKFYNTESKIAVPAVLSTTQYDLVPIESNSLIYTKDLLVHGGVEAGYDAPTNPEMSIALTAQPNPQQKLVTISGLIKIFTPTMLFDTGHRYGNFVGSQFYFSSSGICLGSLYRQPRFAELNGLILHDSVYLTPPVTATDPNPVAYPRTPFSWYGGGGFRPDVQSYQNFDVQAQTPNQYDQRTPEGGWAVYAAGTPYFCMSRQGANGAPNIPLEMTADGALEVFNPNLQNSSFDSNRSLISAYFAPASNNIGPSAGSGFQLKVPPGKYIIRLPSHWCSFGDVLGKGAAYDLTNSGLTWQKTSTNIWGCFDIHGNWLPGQQEFIVDVSNGQDIDVGSFVVADLAPCPGYDFLNGTTALPWTNYCGYLYDCNGRLDAHSSTWEGVPVELAGLTIFNNGVNDLVNGIGQTSPQLTASCQAFTDHNGYFFLCGDNYLGSSGTSDVVMGIDARSVNNFQLRSIATPYYSGTLSDILQKTFGYQSQSPPINNLYSIFLTTDESNRNNTNPNPRDSCMTFIEGQFIDQNNQPVGGINIALTQGAVGYSDIDGEFALRAWGNTKQLLTNALWGNQNSKIIAGVYGGPVKIAASFYNSGQIVWWQNPVGTVNGRTLTPVYYNLSEFNITGFSAIFVPIILPNFALNPNTQTNTPPYSPTSVWSNGIQSLQRLSYYIQNAHVNGGFYKYAVRYQDTLGRQCSVIAPNSLGIYNPFDTEDLNQYYPQAYPVPGTYLQGIRNLVMTVNNPPPIWADCMTVLRTLEKRMVSYLDWIANDVEYVQRTPSNTAATDYVTSYENKDATHIRINIANIAFYNAEFPESNVTYSWQANDRLRLKWDNNLNYYEGLFDYQIVFFESPGYLYIPFDQSLPQLFAGTGLRVYTPKDTTEVDIYYEVGISIPCTTPGQIGNALTQTVIPLTDGDCYWRSRNIPVFDTVDIYAQDYPAIIQSQSISDLYVSNDQDIGRAGIVDPYFKQTFYPTNLRPSSTYIYESQTNGLSTYLPLNDVVVDPSYGAIQRLFQNGLTLVVVCENKVDSYYLGGTLNADQSGTGIITISQAIFGNERPEETNFGCQNPESCVQYMDNGYIYGWDARRGLSWRKSTNGLIKISDYKAKAFFNQFRNTPIWSSPATYDAVKDKYILTIYPKITIVAVLSKVIINGGPSSKQNTYSFNFSTSTPNTINVGSTITVSYSDSNGRLITGNYIVYNLLPNNGFAIVYPTEVPKGTSFQISYQGTGQTIAFHEADTDAMKGWTNFYSFTPDCYASINNQMVSFKGGQLWLHDKDTNTANYNNFYGVKYPSILTMVFNEMPAEIKNWWAILLNQIQSNQGNDWYVPNITNVRGQVSNIPNVNFEYWFQYWHAFTLRDVNTPNKTFPLIEGNLLQSNTLLVTLENPSNNQFSLVEARMNFTSSKGTTK